jgi:hypothetical protein
MRIFVGNLSFAATETDVRNLFEGFGEVAAVRILMEKKGVKSRGFGFVDMPVDQQAQEAISALNGKEFMGRPLNLEQARIKPEAPPETNAREEIKPERESESRHYNKEDTQKKETWFDPVFNKKRGRYKTGRRSRSFMKRRAEAGIVEEAMPKRKPQDNPMRWRKRSEQPKPWQKSRGEATPWKKTEGEFKPARQDTGEFKPWRKSGSKPWQKNRGEATPWKKTDGEFKPARQDTGEFRPWRKALPKPWQRKDGESKPWQKTREERRPWKQSKLEPKQLRKKSKLPRRHESRIQSRRKPGGYTRGN